MDVWTVRLAAKRAACRGQRYNRCPPRHPLTTNPQTPKSKTPFFERGFKGETRSLITAAIEASTMHPLFRASGWDNANPRPRVQQVSMPTVQRACVQPSRIPVR